MTNHRIKTFSFFAGIVLVVTGLMLADMHVIAGIPITSFGGLLISWPIAVTATKGNW